jgi:hypothetical protein
MVFPTYIKTISLALKSNLWAVQAAVTGVSLEACGERFTWNDLQISKEWNVKCTYRNQSMKHTIIFFAAYRTKLGAPLHVRPIYKRLIKLKNSEKNFTYPNW